MSLKNFRTFNLAVSFHKLCLELKVPYYVKEQLNRASFSIALNLAEGSGKPVGKDQNRFYFIALGSLRECQAILLIIDIDEEANELAEKLVAHILQLTNMNKQKMKSKRRAAAGP